MLAFLLNGEIQSRFLEGLLTTLWLTGASAILAMGTGLLAAYLRMSGNTLLEKLGTAYIEVFRNTPLLIQLYLFYRGLSSTGVILPPEACGILALGLYTGAYLAEVFRSGLLSLPPQQLQAGLSLGLSRGQVFWQVLLPQAIRVILPPLGNQLINLAKNSSLVAFVTVSDLFYVIYKGAVDEFRPMEYFLEGALLYLAVSLAIAGSISALDWWLDRPKRRSLGGEAATHG